MTADKYKRRMFEDYAIIALGMITLCVLACVMNSVNGIWMP